MTLLEEIREYFASMSNNSAIELKKLPNEYPALVIRFSDGYGVAIKVEDETEVTESFNGCRFYTAPYTIDGESSKYLVLNTMFEEYRYNFATVCAELVEPGLNGEYRKELIKNPYGWFEKWKEMLGNSNSETRVYDVIAEMCVLEHKLKDDKSAIWTATRMGSHDIECNMESCEVKSTCKRYGASITISGQYQLLHNKPLYLYFCRMEESLDGVSINDMIDALQEVGYDVGKLDAELFAKGFPRGSHARDIKYKINEKRLYEVDDNFPKIVSESFVGGSVPQGVIHIEYEVDLDSLKYCPW